MSRSKFGWDLPPGVSHRAIEEAFGDKVLPIQPVELTPEDREILNTRQMWGAFLRDRLYGKDWETTLGIAHYLDGLASLDEPYSMQTVHWRLAFNESPARVGWIAEHPHYGQGMTDAEWER